MATSGTYYFHQNWKLVGIGRAEGGGGAGARLTGQGIGYYSKKSITKGKVKETGG